MEIDEKLFSQIFLVGYCIAGERDSIFLTAGDDIEWALVKI